MPTELATWDFCGTFLPEDVSILLQPMQIDTTPVAEKERLIQSGKRHYSEMISREEVPSEAYLSLFHAAVERNAARFAADLWKLSRMVAASLTEDDVALVSLARAGTPVGVLIGRALRHIGFDCRHYSVSIIRDRGIDEVAMQWIRRRYSDPAIRFLDGWTGKGVIERELRRAIAQFNDCCGAQLRPELYAVADLCGAAHGAATREDYLIPSAILGATVAGLISRSILNEQVMARRSFHGCLFLEEMSAEDLSRWFVERIWQEMLLAAGTKDVAAFDNASAGEAAGGKAAATISTDWLHWLMQTYAISNLHHVKPGICEATRVLLRRVPDRLIVRSGGDAEVDHLLLLANQKCVPISIDPQLPVRAVALIKDVRRK